MRGKHRRSAQVRDAARLDALKATYDARLASETQAYAEQANALREQIDKLQTNGAALVAKLASDAITKAQQDADAVENSTRDSWDLFCAALADAMFSSQEGDEPWNPNPEQLKRFSEALGLPEEIVLAMREQVISLGVE